MVDMLRALANEQRTAVENWCRAQARSTYVGDGKALCRVLGKYFMLVQANDLSLAPHLMLDGYWEMWITQLVARSVKHGMRCADVGANFGYYTVLLSDLAGDAGRVVAWEPQQCVAELLRSTVQLNGCRNVQVIEAAVGRERGTDTLYVDEKFRGNAALWIPPRDIGCTASVVAVDTLDAQGVFDFVKIDAEGAEPQVWSGMQRSLENKDVQVLMEFAPSRQLPGFAEALLDDIASRGFGLRRVTDDGALESITREQALSAEWQMLWLQR